MIQKRVISPNRVRRLPKCDWSWVDRRFLREFTSKLSGDAVFLYYILVAVSDKNGLSHYSDNALSLMVRTSLPSLLKARQELIDHDLVGYRIVQLVHLYGRADVLKAMRAALEYKTIDAAYVESLVVQARRKASLPSPTMIQPKRKELIQLELDLPDPGRYDRFTDEDKP